MSGQLNGTSDKQTSEALLQTKHCQPKPKMENVCVAYLMTERLPTHTTSRRI